LVDRGLTTSVGPFFAHNFGMLWHLKEESEDKEGREAS